MSSQVMPINSRNVMHNTRSLNFSRTALSVLAGCAAGILGLSSLLGIFFYFLASGVLGLYYMLIRSQSDSLHFMNKQQLITGFVFENLFTYILMWTLIYGCVHVYWRRTRWCRKRNFRNYFIYYWTILLRVVYLISFQN